MNYYEILGVSPSAPTAVVDAAWKALLRVAHPDKGGNPEVARQINEAHAVLSDPAKRSQYDNWLRAQTMPQWTPQMGYWPPQHSSQPPSPFAVVPNMVEQRLVAFFDRLLTHLDSQASEALDIPDPGQGTLYEFPGGTPPRRRRRA